MDKSSEKETHDYFMNVDSFSQLPFIRSVPAKNKAIKLFGIEFGVDEKDTDKHPINSNQEIKERDNNGESSSSSSNRRFECHYCRRSFPTSQALGGHQNAHKRERQHAKRAHLLPAMVGISSSLSDHCGVYGNQSMSSYPTWNTISNSSTRFFDGHVLSFMQQPISGSSLALWRIPTVHSVVSAVNRNRRPSLLQPLPLFAGDGGMKPSLQVDHGSGLSQGRLGFEPQPSMQDHVSLDLHL